MKRILRLGDCYALAKHKLKQYTIRYISLLAVVTSMCLYAVKQVSAQTAEPAATAVADIKPLQIGDTIPEYLWRLALQVVNQPEGKKTITLDDYRDKLILLDFWATHCMPCIGSLQKLDAIQPNYSTDLQVLPISGEDSSQVSAFIEKKQWSLPSIVGKNPIASYFPHIYIPHQVWIRDGIVLAITGHRSANEKNIVAAINRVFVDLPQKRDIHFDPFMPLVSYIPDGASSALFQTFFTGYLPGLGGAGTHKKDGIRATYFNNLPLLQLIHTALKIPYHQIVVEVADATRLFSSNSKANRYCYQLFTVDTLGEQALRRKMISDIGNAGSLKIKKEVRIKECYVVNRVENPRHSGSGNLTTKTLLGLLNYQSEWVENAPIFIDATGEDNSPLPWLTPNDILKRKTDMNLLEKYLREHGFVLTKEEREVPLWIISDYQEL